MAWRRSLREIRRSALRWDASSEIDLRVVLFPSVAYPTHMGQRIPSTALFGAGTVAP